MTLAPGTDRIESERLLLRRITGDDYDFFARLHAMPQVRRYLGNGRPYSTEESRAWIEGMLATYESLNLGQLAVVRKSDGAGIELIYAPDLGYALDPASWAHGYATEAARCVFDYARRDLRWPRIVSVIHPDNARSLRVAERSGLRRDGEVGITERVLEQYVWPVGP